MQLWKTWRERRGLVITFMELNRGRGGLDKAEWYLESGGFSDPREIRLARRWLKRERAKEHEAWLRSPAGAPTRQADAAEAASRWAAFAVVISVFALALSAWPYLREILAN